MLCLARPLSSADELCLAMQDYTKAEQKLCVELILYVVFTHTTLLNQLTSHNMELTLNVDMEPLVVFFQ